MSMAKNAIESYDEALRTTSANIANVSVTGYKRLDVSFQSIYEKLIRQGTASSNNMGGTNPQQLGQGVGISNISVDFSAGSFSAGTSLSLAISGEGLFILSPDGGNSYLYTRAGNFSIDANGSLTSNGMQVYGLDTSGTQVPITNLPSGSTSNYQWLADGRLQYTTDPTAATPVWIDTGYSIALTRFPNASGLAQAQGTAFAQTISSGPPNTAQLPGGAVGSIQPGQLEASNVSYFTETINAANLQRVLNGNLAIVKMASDLISSVISKLSG